MDVLRPAHPELMENCVDARTKNCNEIHPVQSHSTRASVTRHWNKSVLLPQKMYYCERLVCENLKKVNQKSYKVFFKGKKRH
jgi:hypothetical protein